MYSRRHGTDGKKQLYYRHGTGVMQKANQHGMTAAKDRQGVCGATHDDMRQHGTGPSCRDKDKDKD